MLGRSSLLTSSVLGWRRVAIASALAGLLLSPMSAQADSAMTAVDSGSFYNPIYENGADPWLEYYDGNYYLTTTTWTSQLVMRKSATLAGLADAEPVYVWSEVNPDRCCNFWAYEFHRLQGPDGYRWYMMFTSGRQENLDGQHLTVLESVGDDPMGPYQFKGSPMPDSWNIDGNYMTVNEQLYLLWSEWVGDEQLNWIAKMSNPWTITGERQVLSRPEYEWEKSGRKVNEGPETLQHDGRTFVVYSASYCDTPDYKLALLELIGDDPLNPEHWKKYSKPVFERNNGVFGPGHNGFFKSPDGQQDWLIYHGNDSADKGCSATRSLRAQAFSWSDEGLPVFGEPLAETTKVSAPSGENGPMQVVPQGAPLQIQNDAGQCLVNSQQFAACDDASAWVIDPLNDGSFRLANDEGMFLTAAQCMSNNNADNQPWQNKPCQRWSYEIAANGQLTLRNQQQTTLANLQLNATQPLALVSRQSGRVLTVAADQRVLQRAWQAEQKQQQQWLVSATNSGAMQFKQNGQCALVTEQSLAAGASIKLGDCQLASSHWYLQPQANGAYVLRSAHSQQVMDLASCGLADDTAINQAPLQQGSICQQFFLREVK